MNSSAADSPAIGLVVLRPCLCFVRSLCLVRAPPCRSGSALAAHADRHDTDVRARRTCRPSRAAHQRQALRVNRQVRHRVDGIDDDDAARLVGALPRFALTSWMVPDRIGRQPYRGEQRTGSVTIVIEAVQVER